MFYNEFRDLKISALGMGSLRLPTVPGNQQHIDRAKARKVIDCAFENGINYFDTAYTYHSGDSERAFGEILSCYPRDRYYLATKFYVAAGISIEEMFEEQLKRCRTDYFDFYLFHGMQENYFDAYTDAEKNYLEYLLEQKRRGRIRFFGFSSHAAPETLERFLRWYDGFDMAMIQMNYLDWTMLDAKKQYDILTEHHLPVWVMEPLKGGRLATLNERAEQILKKVSPENSVASWSFRYLMGLPNVQTVLSGMASPEQVIDNAKVFAQRNVLSKEEQRALQEAVSVFKDELGVPCSACRYCCPVCPEKIDIPLLIKGYNEAVISGETWRLAELKEAKGADQCRQCGACSKRCPQKIDIPEVIKKFARLTEAGTL